MSIAQAKKKEIQEKFRLHEKDTGSTPLQIAVLTLDHLSSENEEKYKKIIKDLGLRR